MCQTCVRSELIRCSTSGCWSSACCRSCGCTVNVELGNIKQEKINNYVVVVHESGGGGSSHVGLAIGVSCTTKFVFFRDVLVVFPYYRSRELKVHRCHTRIHSHDMLEHLQDPNSNPEYIFG